MIRLAVFVLLLFLLPGQTGFAHADTIVVAQTDSSKLLVQKRDAPAASAGWWTRLTTYIRIQQHRFHSQLAKAFRGIKEHNSIAATWSLVVLSFLYGVFHAAGPGHGKAVISAYLLADERLLRRGVILAFVSSFLQAVTAIVLVTAVVLAVTTAGRTAKSMVAYLETASYGLICLIGLYMLWTALRGGHSHAHGHDHHGHDHDHSCGHAHIPDASKLGDGWSYRKAASIAFAVGIRPCSGAVLVLLFANTLGLYAAGVSATFAMSLGTAITVSAIAVATVLFKNVATSWLGPESRWAARVFRGLAVTGALAVLVLGLVLLTASLDTGRPPI